MARVHHLAIVAAIAAAGCGKSVIEPPTDDDAASDTHLTDAAADRVGDRAAEAPTCCRIDPPMCNCFQIGGSPLPSGLCPSICDAPPINWKTTTDDNGCPLLVQDPPGGSCLIFPRDGGDGG